MFDITSAESPIAQQPLNQTLLEGTITRRLSVPLRAISAFL